MLDFLDFMFLLDVQADLPETSPFLSAQMFIVLGMYNFADDTNHDIQSRDAPNTQI